MEAQLEALGTGAPVSYTHLDVYKRQPIDRAYYICQTYNRLGKNACTSHKIEARDLYNLVLKDIQELAAQAMKDADAFYQRLSSRMERRYLVDASQTEKERKRLEDRNQEIDGMFLSLYTDKAKGCLLYTSRCV